MMMGNAESARRHFRTRIKYLHVRLRGTWIRGFFTMDDDAKLRESLEELKKVTGLPLSLDGTGGEDAADTLEKIAMLTSAWRDKYDRTNFLRNLLYGNISDTDLYAAASRFHIPERGRRVLYVIECAGAEAENAGRILRQMFVLKAGDQLAVLDELRVVLIKSLSKADQEDTLTGDAHTMVDMLNMEAMIRARVGFASPIETLKDMPEAFRNALVALKIGSIFYMSETALNYNRLGIGRLIYDLPESSCRLFLKEVLGDISPDDFDEETVSIISAFFENNLNISETARQLYVHRNTLVYRLEKLHQATGLDLRFFDDAIALKLAMMISDALKNRT